MISLAVISLISRRRFVSSISSNVLLLRLCQFVPRVFAVSARLGAKSRHVVATFASVVLLGEFAGVEEIRPRVIILAGFLRAVVLRRTLARAFMVDVTRFFARGPFHVALPVAFVQQIHGFGVFERQRLFPFRIADRELIILIFGDDGEISGDGEGVRTVMHDGAIIVSQAAGVRVALNVEIELDSGLRVRVLSQHQQRFVSVHARLFVVQS